MRSPSDGGRTESEVPARGLPIFFAWLLGALVIACIFGFFWNHEHSLGALILYAIILSGVIGGAAHTRAHLKNKRSAQTENASRDDL